MATLVLSIASFGCQGPSNWTLAIDEKTATVSNANRPIFCYRHGEVPYKPYIQTIHTPKGINILRDAPHDHLHHHGIMYAINVDDVECWAETKDCGYQISRKTEAINPHSSGGIDRAGIRQAIEWTASDRQKVLLREDRVVEAIGGRGIDASLITWQTVLSTPPGKGHSELTGRNYFGLGMRFVPSMDKGGQFFNADGKRTVAGTDNVRSKWCAYTAASDCLVVTVAMFDHPANPRHPATWFTMDSEFAYMSLTPDLHHQDILLKEGQDLRYCFGVALWDGEVAANRIEKLYQQWVTMQTPRK